MRHELEGAGQFWQGIPVWGVDIYHFPLKLHAAGWVPMTCEQLCLFVHFQKPPG